MQDTLMSIFQKISRKISHYLWRPIKNFVKTFHWKNIFSFSNIIKIFFIYSMVLLYVIISTIEYSDNFWKNIFLGKKPEVRLSIYSTSIRSGENLIYKRIQDLANKAGWQYSSAKFDENYSSFWFTNLLYQSASSLINFIFKPQFNLIITHHVRVFPYGYNVVYLNVPNDTLYKKNFSFSDSFPHLQDADAYIDLYTYVNGINPVLEENLAINKQRYKRVFSYYLAVDKQDVYKEANYDILKSIIVGSLWGCNRSSLRMSMALSKLAQDDMLYGYGHEYALSFLKGNYKGKIESFGKGDVDKVMTDMYRHYGISLSFHTLEHHLEGLPTSRALEAVASGAVVISDEHPFFKKHFNDSMFFVNTLTNQDEIHAQVKSHINWIRGHKEESKQKARIAYQIFLQHFTLSKQLQALAEDVIGKKLSKDIND
jgi:hypothetical protein